MKYNCFLVGTKFLLAENSHNGSYLFVLEVNIRIVHDHKFLNFLENRIGIGMEEGGMQFSKRSPQNVK